MVSQTDTGHTPETTTYWGLCYRLPKIVPFNDWLLAVSHFYFTTYSNINGQRNQGYMNMYNFQYKICSLMAFNNIFIHSCYITCIKYLIFGYNNCPWQFFVSLSAGLRGHYNNKLYIYFAKLSSSWQLQLQLNWVSLIFK